MESEPQARRKSRTNIVLAIFGVVIVVTGLSALLFFPAIDSSCGCTSTPLATYSGSAIPDGVRINIVSIAKTYIPWDDVKVQLSDGINHAEWSPKKSDLDGGLTMTAPYITQHLGNLYMTLWITDISGNGYVSGGDYFVLAANPDFSSGASYTAVLVYEPTGERLGVGIEFFG